MGAEVIKSLFFQSDTNNEDVVLFLHLIFMSTLVLGSHRKEEIYELEG